MKPTTNHSKTGSQDPSTASAHCPSCNAAHEDHEKQNQRPDRRSFLKTSALTAGAAAVGAKLPAQAHRLPLRRGNATKVTIVLFQRGGADGLNLYAPTGDPAYANLRPGLAITHPGSGSPFEGLPLTSMFSMHPSMPGLAARFSAPNSNLAIVPAVGQTPYDLSHFESQDLFETGSLNGSLIDGWVNRHLQATATSLDSPVRALALRNSLPRSLSGSYPCYAVKRMRDMAFHGSASDVRQYLETITNGTPTGGMSPTRQLAYQTGIDCFELIDYFTNINPSNYTPANGAVYPSGSLGTAMREAAEVIKANLDVEFFAIDQAGWDHHSNLTSRLNPLAIDYDQAISAFLTDLGALAADVVVLGMTEFGRTAAQNGSGGTDHGVGGAMLVAGGSVLGGQIYGNWPGLDQASLLNNRYLMPTVDFRDVILEVLQDHMGGTDPNAVFPGHTYAPVGLI